MTDPADGLSDALYELYHGRSVYVPEKHAAFHVRRKAAALNYVVTVLPCEEGYEVRPLCINERPYRERGES